MASLNKKKTEDFAEYECVLPSGCVVHIQNPKTGGTSEKLFRLNDGDIPYDECMLKVPRGTVVCKHFEPFNDAAAEDRDEQMEHPERFVKHEIDKVLLAEIMVKKGFFKNKVEAAAAITELMKDGEVEETAESIRAKAIAKMVEEAGATPKEKRSALGKILKDGDVKGFFPGATPESLATLIYDNGLYKG